MKDQVEEIGLPEAFLEKMEGLLGEEYESFLESYGMERARGLRLNPLKVKHEEDRRALISRFGLRKIPWAEEGYFYGGDVRPGRHALHEAGVYYLQEPSAMAVVELLDPQPGEKVLDLCAAPGGKTTQIGGRMMGEGLLLSNEIHPARAKILSQNVERMGIANAVVTNEEAGKLAGYFPCFFDKIVVDAPCSGEGMFRKDPEARNQWSPEHVRMCAGRQQEILDYGAVMLRPGGRLVYSTCTFSPEENEGTIRRFLERNPDFYVERTEAYEGFDRGRPEWNQGGKESTGGTWPEGRTTWKDGNGQGSLADTFRIWPHHLEGEGHYLAILRKDEQAEDNRIQKPKMPGFVKERQVKELWQEFCRDTLTEEGTEGFGKDANKRLVLFGEQLYLVPEHMPDYGGLRVLRPGLHLGTWKKNRFEPAHSLALCLCKEQVKRWYDKDGEGSQMAAYLRGETLPADGNKGLCPDRQENQEKAESGNGWALILADGYSAGWVKKVGGILKNHYPKGLRQQRS